jgi:hypothetical protein
MSYQQIDTSSSGQGFIIVNVVTTNATPTTIASVVVPEGQCKTMFGVIVGAQDDATEGCGGTFNITVKRAAAGNVTLVGSLNQNLNADAGSFTATADVATQSILVTVTGVAAETWNWQLKFIVCGV